MNKKNKIIKKVLSKRKDGTLSFRLPQELKFVFNIHCSSKISNMNDYIICLIVESLLKSELGDIYENLLKSNILDPSKIYNDALKNNKTIIKPEEKYNIRKFFNNIYAHIAINELNVNDEDFIKIFKDMKTIFFHKNKKNIVVPVISIFTYNDKTYSIDSKNDILSFDSIIEILNNDENILFLYGIVNDGDSYKYLGKKIT